MGDSLPFLLPDRLSGQRTARLARAGSAFRAGSFVQLNAIPSVSRVGLLWDLCSGPSTSSRELLCLACTG